MSLTAIHYINQGTSIKRCEKHATTDATKEKQDSFFGRVQLFIRRAKETNNKTTSLSSHLFTPLHARIGFPVPALANPSNSV